MERAVDPEMRAIGTGLGGVLNSYPNDMKKRTIAIFAGAITSYFLCVTGIWAEPLSFGSQEGLEALGLDYQFREIKEPRLNRVHVLKIDLALGKVRLATVIADDPDGEGPAEAALTSPLKLASDQSVLAFVNTNPLSGFDDGSKKSDRGWIEGQPVDIHGFAVSDGRIRSQESSARMYLTPSSVLTCRIFSPPISAGTF